MKKIVLHRMFYFLFTFICKKAGYPINMFSPHSIRSGFVCSMILNAVLSKNSRYNSIFEKTRIVGGWAKSSSAFRVYVRRVAICSLVSSRFVEPTDEKNLNLCESTNVQLEKFHNVESIESQWNIDIINYRAIYNSLLKIFLKRYEAKDYGYDYSFNLTEYFKTMMPYLLRNFGMLYHESFYSKWIKEDIEIYKESANKYVVIKIKEEIIYPLIREESEKFRLESILNKLLIESDDNYNVSNTWSHSEDSRLVEFLKTNQNLRQIKIYKRNFYSIIKRYESLIQEYESVNNLLISFEKNSNKKHLKFETKPGK